MPFEEILRIKDIDQRTQAMRFGDVKKFISHTKAFTLDEKLKFKPDGASIIYRLLRISKGETFREDAYYLFYECPSTGKKYMSGVEPFKTVDEAMAWKFEISPGDWNRMKLLSHES